MLEETLTYSWFTVLNKCPQSYTLTKHQHVWPSHPRVGPQYSCHKFQRHHLPVLEQNFQTRFLLSTKNRIIRCSSPLQYQRGKRRALASCLGINQDE